MLFVISGPAVIVQKRKSVESRPLDVTVQIDVNIFNYLFINKTNFSMTSVVEHVYVIYSPLSTKTYKHWVNELRICYLFWKFYLFIRFSLAIVFNISDMYANPSHRAHNVKMTLYRRQCDASTSHRRQYSVISTLCACWNANMHSIPLYLTLLHSDQPKLYGVLAVLSAIGLAFWLFWVH